MLEHEKHTLNVAEVDEGITNIVSGLEVDAQIDEVVSAEADTIKKRLQGHLGRQSVQRRLQIKSRSTYPIKLVRDVTQHNGSANISTALNATLVDTVMQKLRIARLVDGLHGGVRLGVAEVDKTAFVILARVVTVR